MRARHCSLSSRGAPWRHATAHTYRHGTQVRHTGPHPHTLCPPTYPPPPYFFGLGQTPPAPTHTLYPTLQRPPSASAAPAPPRWPPPACPPSAGCSGRTCPPWPHSTACVWTGRGGRRGGEGRRGGREGQEGGGAGGRGGGGEGGGVGGAGGGGQPCTPPGRTRHSSSDGTPRWRSPSQPVTRFHTPTQTAQRSPAPLLPGYAFTSKTIMNVIPPCPAPPLPCVLTCGRRAPRRGGGPSMSPGLPG